MTEREIFIAALEWEDADERAALLNEACGSDQQLRERVELLLRSHEKVGSFLDLPAGEGRATIDMPAISEGPGTVIGRYKLLQQIGEGGFGVVFMAEQTEPVRRRVAMKIIKPGMDTKEVIARFEAERQALALMDHPNIAKVFDGGVTESGRPFFVMELVKGVPLTKFCDTNRFDMRARLKLFVHVCHAIQHAHHKGVVHRDVKPSNVLVTLHDGVPVPKVIDFGISKALNQQLTEKTLFTAFGQMVGTAQYMSPEQAELSGLDIDTRSDVYSLGVLLYELLTGTTPLESGTLKDKAHAEVQRLIREIEPPRPSMRLSMLGEASTQIAANRSATVDKLSALVRSDLDWVVMKCLEKDRSRRYDTANVLAADVERFLKQEPVEACPPSLGYQISKFIRRNKVAVTAATAVLLALLLGVAGMGFGFMKAQSEAKRAQEEKENATTLLTEKTTLASKLTDELRSRQRRLYAADMAEAFEAWRDGGVAWAAELIARHADSEFQSWEWHYLAAKLNSDQSIDIANAFGWSLRMSPDQNYIAVIHPQRRVFSLFEKETGRRLEDVGNEKKGTWTENYVEFSDDSKRLVHSANGKRRLVVREVPSCRVLASCDHNRQIIHALFRRASPEEEIVFADADGNVFLFDTAKGEAKITPVRLSEVSDNSRLLCRPDGSRIIHGGKSKVDFIDLEGASIESFPGHEGQIFDIELIEDLGLLVTCSADRTIRVWDSESGELQKILGGFDEEVRALTFDPGSKVLAASTRSRQIHRWNIVDFSQRPTLVGHHGMLGLEFDSNGDLYFLTQKYTLAKRTRSMDAAPQDVLRVGKVRDMCFSSDGTHLVLLMKPDSASTQIQVYSRRDAGLTLGNRKTLNFEASRLAPLGDSEIVVGDREAGILRVFRLPDCAIIAESNLTHATGVTAIACSDNRNMVAAGLEDGGIWIVNRENFETIIHEHAFHAEEVSEVLWCEHSQSVISGSLDGCVASTSLLTNQTRRLRLFDGPIYNLAVLKKRILVGLHLSEDMDRSIIELNQDGDILQRSAPFIFNPSGIAPLLRENTIVAIGQDRTLRFMDADSLRTRVSLSEDEIFERIIAAPDDSMLAATTREGGLFLYIGDESATNNP